MKKIITAAIVCGIILATLSASNFSSGFKEGLISGLLVITILAGASAVIAIKERRKHAWH